MLESRLSAVRGDALPYRTVVLNGGFGPIPPRPPQNIECITSGLHLSVFELAPAPPPPPNSLSVTMPVPSMGNAR